MHTTDHADFFIEVAEDRPVDASVAPPEREPATVARMQYDALVDAPYECSPRYAELAADDGLKHLRAMRRSRAR